MMRRIVLSLCFALLPGVLTAQSRPVPELKDPEMAQTYALYMPGGGYLYTGEYARAAIALGVTGVAAYKVIHIATCNYTYASTFGGTEDCSGSSKWLWVAAAFAPYVYGIFDAEKSANRVNTQLRSVADHALLDLDRHGRIELGARVAIGSHSEAK